jgi:hypothetical protein
MRKAQTNKTNRTFHNNTTSNRILDTEPDYETLVTALPCTWLARACEHTDDDLGFSDWLEELDRLTLAKSDLSIHDLPDMPFRDAFLAGQPADEFFAEEVSLHLAELGYQDDDAD